ncbi:MAG TPA: zinc ribbon domain-containing protein [Pyrinomonadaceae bacterium]|nr:zinc ribbon domain-containing protein [Pyrinomonadaceae bacterium]
MFCPKCATQNLDGASFCRGCGANISLVPQAMTGEMAPAIEENPTTEEVCARTRKPLTIDNAVRNVFLGFAFLLIALVLSRTIGQVWWFWMLIPAFSLMGAGVGQFIRIRDRDRRELVSPTQRAVTARPTAPPLHAPNTEQLMPPVASVTEGTTRHLAKTPEHR